ncbi:MAG: GNAT family N-acetyltransferase [Candidatus Bathyarchaeia archaeon]
MKIRICQPETEEDFERYYDLRWRILRRPWKQPKGTEKDEYEGCAIHVMACAEGRVVGVGRAHFNSEEEAQIRYMAVEAEYRGKGVGSSLIKELERRIREKGARYVVVNARENAVGFYLKNGYEVTGEAPTLFGCIHHRRMRKQL